MTDNQKLLDIGTGSGLLSLMIAQKSPVSIDAIEIEDGAFQQAIENSGHSPWASRIHVIHADVRAFPFPREYDVIVSNPPFYEKELKSGDDGRNLAHHAEMLNMEDLLSVIRKKLQANGRFFLLLPFKRWEEIREIMKGLDLYPDHIIFVRPTVQHSSFRVMISGRKLIPGISPKMDVICIRDEEGVYTSTFFQLLREYYLYL
jgi:tRNA1Val (adenine37-N6)-methyltransferase